MLMLDVCTTCMPMLMCTCTPMLMLEVHTCLLRHVLVLCVCVCTGVVRYHFGP